VARNPDEGLLITGRQVERGARLPRVSLDQVRAWQAEGRSVKGAYLYETLHAPKALFAFLAPTGMIRVGPKP
jgi:hypothetical protein